MRGSSSRPGTRTPRAYLGDARWYLDTVFNRRGGGMQALGPMKWLEPVNWKTMVDNCSDNYHVPTSHLSSARVQTRYLGRPRLSHEDQFASPNKARLSGGGRFGRSQRNEEDLVSRSGSRFNAATSSLMHWSYWERCATRWLIVRST
jgi:phenylpropionate dioxygenase-like ring-hydroxylating dioxygenase large terminal subunit